MSGITYRLEWFELQVCPLEFRLAVIPEQPTLIGFGGEGEEGETALIPYEENAAAVDRLIESLDALVRRHRLFETAMRAPERCFEDDPMQTASLHLRVAYADGTRWAAMYPLAKVPANVQALLDECRELGRRVIRESRGTPLSPEAALSVVDPEGGAGAPRPPAVIARVKVRRSGEVLLDGRPTDLKELRRVFDRLKKEGGGVWYYREDPAGEPPAEAMVVIQAVIDAQLPIRLCEEDFDS
jgi:hypothetical protein